MNPTDYYVSPIENFTFDILTSICESDIYDECGVCDGDGTSCCEDGETNNDNPCNPWECISGEWY